jgi:hypothetical protein
MRAQFARLREVLVDHVEHGLGQRQRRAGVELPVKLDDRELDIGIAEIGIGAGAVAFEEFEGLDTLPGSK